MKKLFAVAGLAGLFSVGLAVPAHAAEPTDPAPTNVQISWKDDTYKFVHVTWTEDEPRPNRVIVRKAGTTGYGLIKAVAADAPNAIDLPKRDLLLVGSKLEVGVSVGDAAAETSLVGLSVPFDTIDAGAPVIQSFQPSGSSTLRVTWKAGTPVFRDTTPGDPLDLDLPVTYQPAYRIGNADPVLVGQPITGTTATVTGPTPPYSLTVQAVNEWTSISSTWIGAYPMPINASIPTWVVAGKETVIRTTFGDPVGGPGNAQVTLQARNSATSPWYVVGSYESSGQEYQFNIPSVGTRQYRIAIGNANGYGPYAFFGGYSPPVTTTVQQKTRMVVDTYGVLRNHPATGTLFVTPAVGGSVALQRWNGKTWVFVRNTPLKSGLADFQMSSPTAGTFVYRYYVPAHTNNGLPVAAAYSTNFTIKVF